MLAYFVRRLIGGLVSAFGVSLLLYAFMVYGPFGLNYEYYLLTHLADKPVDIYGAYRLVDSYHIEKSWPLNYGQWLLNLDNKDGVLGTGFVDTPQRNDCTVGGRIYHKGILAGDWDYHGECVLVPPSSPCTVSTYPLSSPSSSLPSSF